MEIRRHPKQGRRQVSPDPCLLYSLQHLFFSKIMICKNSYPIIDHFCDSHQGSHINILICHLALIWPYHFIKPGICRNILSNSLKDIHGSMGMQVCQSRTDIIFTAINCLIRMDGFCVLCCRQNFQDFPFLHIYILIQNAICFFIQKPCIF